MIVSYQYIVWDTKPKIELCVWFARLTNTYAAILNLILSFYDIPVHVVHHYVYTLFVKQPMSAWFVGNSLAERPGMHHSIHPFIVL